MMVTGERRGTYGSNDGMILTGENGALGVMVTGERRGTRRETCPFATLSATNPTRTG